MKNKKLFMLLLVAGVMFSLSSCDRAIRKIVDTALEEVLDHDYKDSEELGPVVTRDIESGDFTKIITHGAVKVEVAQDSVCRLQVFGNEKSIENYDIVVEDGVLRADKKGDSDKVDRNTPRITLRLSLPVLNNIQANGAGDIDLNGRICQAEPLEIEINGAGDIDIENLEATELKVEISGAGDMDIERVKCSGDTRFNVKGAGDVEANVECRELEAEVSGAGDMDLTVQCDILRASVNGAGEMTLKGRTRKLYKSANRAVNVDTEALEVQEP